MKKKDLFLRLSDYIVMHVGAVLTAHWPSGHSFPLESVLRNEEVELGSTTVLLLLSNVAFSFWNIFWAFLEWVFQRISGWIQLERLWKIWRFVHTGRHSNDPFLLFIQKELLTFAASHTTLYDGNVAIDGNGYQTDGSDLDHRYDCMNGVGCCERDYCDIITQSFSEQDEIQNQVKKMTFKSEMTSREQSSGALWHMFNESRELGQLQGVSVFWSQLSHFTLFSRKVIISILFLILIKVFILTYSASGDARNFIYFFVWKENRLIDSKIRILSLEKPILFLAKIAKLSITMQIMQLRSSRCYIPITNYIHVYFEYCSTVDGTIISTISTRTIIAHNVPVWYVLISNTAATTHSIPHPTM